MPERLWPLGTGRFERHLGLRGKAAMYQLPLSAVIFVIAATAPLVNPELLQSGLFLSGLLLHIVLFASCLLIPWERLPTGAVLVIPLVDFIAIGLCRNGAVEILPGMGALAAFPVIWLAVSGQLPVTATILSFAGPYLIVLFPHLLNSSLAGARIVETLLLPTMMLAIFLTMRILTLRVRLERRELHRKAEEVLALEAEGTERERLLAAILDTLDVGVVAVDTEGRTLLSNRQQQLFHEAADMHDDGHELRLSCSKGSTPLPPSQHPIRRAINGESFSNNLVWLGQGGSQRAVSTAAQPMTGSRGEFAGAVIVFNDVTDLVTALTVKEDFVSNVTHEFSTPLTSILGHLDLVLESPDTLTSATRESLGVARRNAERLSTLVSDLLCAVSASMNLHAKPTELSGLLTSRLRSARTHAEDAGVNLVSEFPERLWAIADPLRMGQVVDNLLSNAIKYSPDGGDVTVRARENKGSVLLEVEDRGIGMTTLETGLIYGRFFRAHSARESAIPGVGLGLAITKAIVEGHGGTIHCASSLGSGTTFTVTLPTAVSRAHSSAN
ncbi:ATP-binding protein [Arthrobacter sp. H20]|uniref:sensor histidine kinase n=1 Tax=Arthrobacter sp. H20 TaxID=1267981 RepID=UPI0020A6ACCF|nr:ATP-binding protein [Arthrobacter sp. H20]